jgi:hypothetical protein
MKYWRPHLTFGQHISVSTLVIIEKYSDEWIGTIWVAFQFSIFIIKSKIEIHVLHRICYYEGQVQNTKCIYSLQIKSDKTR